MPQYKLIYFNARGWAEIIRWIFTTADIPFEDFRIDYPIDNTWEEIKPTMPFGKVPALEIDGKEKLGQSLAIARYLARQHGLAGGSPLEEAKVDFLIDCIVDHMKLVANFYSFGELDAKQAELKKKYVEEQIPSFIEKMEAYLVSNHDGDGYLVGTKMTWADLYLSIFLEMNQLTFSIVPCLAKAPKIKALVDKVRAHPRIAAYLANRKNTPA